MCNKDCDSLLCRVGRLGVYGGLVDMGECRGNDTVALAGGAADTNAPEMASVSKRQLFRCFDTTHSHQPTTMQAIQVMDYLTCSAWRETRNSIFCWALKN